MEVIQNISHVLFDSALILSQNRLRPSILQPLTPIPTPQAFYTVRVTVRVESLPLSSCAQLEEETREVNESG
jgi:hypothetical protein